MGISLNFPTNGFKHSLDQGAYYSICNRICPSAPVVQMFPPKIDRHLSSHCYRKYKLGLSSRLAYVLTVKLIVIDTGDGLTHSGNKHKCCTSCLGNKLKSPLVSLTSNSAVMFSEYNSGTLG